MTMMGPRRCSGSGNRGTVGRPGGRAGGASCAGGMVSGAQSGMNARTMPRMTMVSGNSNRMFRTPGDETSTLPQASSARYRECTLKKTKVAEAIQVDGPGASLSLATGDRPACASGCTEPGAFCMMARRRRRMQRRLRSVRRAE